MRSAAGIVVCYPNGRSASRAPVSWPVQLLWSLRVLVMLIVLLASATATHSADLTAMWKINGEGYVGDLIISQASNGELTGTIYGEPMRGFHASQTSDVVLVRGPIGNPTQAFVGTVNLNSSRITGTYYELTPGAQGLNAYRFAAARASTSAPRLPYVLSSFLGPGPSSIAGSHTVFNRPSQFGRSQQGGLSLNQTGSGYLTGGIYGDALVGHYSTSRAGLVFLRMYNNLPYQLFVGQVSGAAPLQAVGNFYALTIGAGANAQTMRYDWATVVPKSADISAIWKINFNGALEEINLAHAPSGTLSGTRNGQNLQGFYSPKERIAAFVSGPPSRPDFAYVGQVSEDGDSMTGELFTLNMSLNGTYARNAIPFAARRGTSTHPTVVPGLRAEVAPSSVDGYFYPFFNRPSEFGLTQRGLLSITMEHSYQPGPYYTSLDGTVTGTLYGDAIHGHYAIGTGTMVFVRLSNNAPFQLYVGDVIPDVFQARGFRGDFYALTAGAGASAERIKFDWLADWSIR